MSDVGDTMPIAAAIDVEIVDDRMILVTIGTDKNQDFASSRKVN